MTDTTTQKLITELRTLQHLTNTEAQIAQTRQVQARDEAVRAELATNAANALERAQLIVAALRDLRGGDDVGHPAQIAQRPRQNSRGAGPTDRRRAVW